MFVEVGDILADRDSRRKGREVKVVAVDDVYVTVEVVRDAYSAKVSSVGNQTLVGIDRLDRAYTIVSTAEEASQEPFEDDDDTPITPEQESDLEAALRSLGYVKIEEPVDDLITALADAAEEEILSYRDTVRLTVEFLRSR